MADDVLVRYKALTDQYLKDVNKVIKANDQVGTSAEQGNKEAQESFKKTGKGLDTLSKSVKRIGGQLIAAFAIKQVVTSAIRTIVQFEDAMAAVSAITGVTGKELDKFRDRIISISKSSGVSAKEVAKAFQLIGSATPELLESAESLGLVTEQAIILSKAARLDLTVASDALTKSLNQFGLEASDAADVVNILATSQQKGTATIDQLNESLKNAGAVANAAGLNFEETNVALQALAKGGQTGAEAGTGLRSVLLRLAKTTDSEINPTINSFSDVIQTLSDRNVTLQQATKLVGDEGARYLLTLLEQNDVVQRLNGNLNEQGNALEQAKINTDTVTFAAEELTTNWENFILSLESGDGTISKVLKGAIELASSLLQKLQDLGKTNEEITNELLDPKLDALFEETLKKRLEVIKTFNKEKAAEEEETTKAAIANAEEELKALSSVVIQRKALSELDARNRTEAIKADKERVANAISARDAEIKAIERTISGFNRELEAIQSLGEEQEKQSTQEVALTKKNSVARKKADDDFLKLQEEVTQQTLDFNEEEEESEISVTDTIREEMEKREELWKEGADAFLKITHEKLQEEDNAEEESRKKRKDRTDAEKLEEQQKILSAINTAQQISDIAFAFAQDQIDLEELNEAEREKIQEKRKKRATAQATIDSFLGASQVFISTPGELIAKSIAAAIALAAGFARVDAIKSTPVSGFAEGTEYVKLGKNKKGKDTIPARLDEGEAVIAAKHNDPTTSKAYNEGRIKEHFFATQTLPALKEQKKRFQENRDVTFADNIANSIGLNFTDKNLVKAMQNNTKVSRKNTDRLEKALKPQRIINRG